MCIIGNSICQPPFCRPAPSSLVFGCNSRLGLCHMRCYQSIWFHFRSLQLVSQSVSQPSSQPAERSCETHPEHYYDYCCCCLVYSVCCLQLPTIKALERLLLRLPMHLFILLSKCRYSRTWNCSGRMELGLHRKLILFLAPCTEAAASEASDLSLSLHLSGRTGGQWEVGRRRKIMGQV